MKSDDFLEVARFVELARTWTEEERETVIHLIRGAGVGRKVVHVAGDIAETAAREPKTEKR